MFRFCAIANLHGEVKFSHYFESVLCAVTNLERDVVQDCLKTGEKEVKSTELYLDEKCH
jgi:hypothetical protein